MGTSEIVLRDAVAADWDAISPIWWAIVRAGETYVWDADVMSDDDARAAWMLPPPAVVLVAEVDRVVVGTAEVRPNQVGRGAHVANASFMVDPEASGLGVGRALAAAVLDRARAEGYRAMQFNAVVATNTRALALWESVGFAVVGRVPGAFHHAARGDVDLVIMHRAL